VAFWVTFAGRFGSITNLGGQMNIDLGSPILDIVIALSFVFFLLSVIVSAVTEFGAGVANLRAKTLKAGLDGMIGDAELVEKVLRHPLVRTRLLTKAGRPDNAANERTPSYIAPQAFARAFRDEVRAAGGIAADLGKQLTALGIDPAAIGKGDLKALEKWFDDSMARVSGWYKRKSQIIALVVAAFVAVGLNANTLRIGEYLEREPTVRSAVVAQAEASAQKQEFSNAGKGEASIEAAGEQASDAYKQIDGLKLPLFWSGTNVPHGLSAWGVALVGWLLTTVAISFGAPFWFDALGKLANLRMAGKKPEREPKTV